MQSYRRNHIQCVFSKLQIYICGSWETVLMEGFGMFTKSQNEYIPKC